MMCEVTVTIIEGSLADRRLLLLKDRYVGKPVFNSFNIPPQCIAWGHPSSCQCHVGIEVGRYKLCACNVPDRYKPLLRELGDLRARSRENPSSVWPEDIWKLCPNRRANPEKGLGWFQDESRPLFSMPCTTVKEFHQPILFQTLFNR
jgi:hypothetical protein